MYKSESDMPASSAHDAANHDRLYGHDPHNVIEAIKNRAQQWKTAERSADGRKIALVVEGGGMRAAYSGGGVHALSQLGYSDVFDAVYATSAGVMNAAYFLSQQTTLGITIYGDCLASKRFVNPLRFWKILDVDYAFDDVITRQKPLNFDQIAASPTDFFVSVIDKTDARGKMVDAKHNAAGMKAVFKAANSIPVLYNRTVLIDGHPCMDGGLAIPFPLKQAIQDGCTDILVLLTQPKTYRRPEPKWIQRWLFSLLCSRSNRELYNLYTRSHVRYQAFQDLAYNHEPSIPLPNVATICPTGRNPIHRTTSDPKLLQAAITGYGEQTLRHFGCDDELW